jgi:hypothetical protein
MSKLKVWMVLGALLAVAFVAVAGDMNYSWEKWVFSEKIDCIIRYDSNGDGQLEDYLPVSTEGYFTFKAGFPFDHVVPEQCDWSAVFESADGSRIELVDAAWNGHENNGRKETFYIYPEHQCVKYFYEGTGTWCGYDEERGVYFWGKWTTLPEGKPYFVDYVLNGDSPAIHAKLIVEGCSDQNHAFEPTEGAFFGTRFEHGQN